MTKLYKIYDEVGVVRIFSNKDEAIGFSALDKSFRIETVKVIKQKLATNKFTWAYKILGQGIV
jgi:hypothetical protein